MSSRPVLEAQLADVTEEFLRKVLAILRNASLADVANVNVGGPGTQSSAPPANRATPQFSAKRGPGRPPVRRGGGKPPAELATTILDALSSSDEPISAKALADKIGVHADHLVKPLKQLRDEGRIAKKGEKRASKYAFVG